MAKRLELKNLLVKWSNGKAQKIGNQTFPNGKNVTLIVPEDQISVLQEMESKTIEAIKSKYEKLPIKEIEKNMKSPYSYNSQYNEYHLKLDFTRIVSEKDEKGKLTHCMDAEGNYVEDICNFIGGEKRLPKVILGDKEVNIPFSGSIVDVILEYNIRFDAKKMDCRININADTITITKAAEGQTSRSNKNSDFEEIEIDLDISVDSGEAEELPKAKKVTKSKKKEAEEDVSIDSDIDSLFD